MDKRIVIVTMASVMLLAGCTVGKKDSVQETGVELGSEVVENSESIEVNDNSEKESAEVQEEKNGDNVVEGKFNKETLNGKIDYGYDKAIFTAENYSLFEQAGSMISISCEETGVYKCNLKEQEKLQHEDSDLSFKHSIGTMTEDESFKFKHYGTELLTDNKNCSNLYVYEDKIYYSNNEGKICTYDFNTKKCEVIEQLKKFNVQFMNVVNKSSIYFISEGTEYQYIIGDTKVTKVKQTPDNFIGCCQTLYGILYLIKNGSQLSDLYINDIKIVEGIDGINGFSCGIENNEIYYLKMDAKTRDCVEYTIDINQLKDAKGIIEGTIEK